MQKKIILVFMDVACCRNDLGSFPHNKDIDTGIEASQSGVHNLVMVGPNFVKTTLPIYCASGNTIVIPQGNLNEDFVYSFQVVQPDGVLLSESDCETFTLQTFINKIACDDIQYL